VTGSSPWSLSLTCTRACLAALSRTRWPGKVVCSGSSFMRNPPLIGTYLQKITHDIDKQVNMKSRKLRLHIEPVFGSSSRVKTRSALTRRPLQETLCLQRSLQGCRIDDIAYERVDMPTMTPRGLHILRACTCIFPCSCIAVDASGMNRAYYRYDWCHSAWRFRVQSSPGV
jgi:hypothetical protein